MKMSTANANIKKLDEIREKLSDIGINVQECEGYSDRSYYFIGAQKTLMSDITNPSFPTWLFTGSDLEEFITYAGLFLLGVEYGRVNAPMQSKNLSVR